MREVVFARATTRFDEQSARGALDVFERRLRGAPFEVLEVPPDAGVVDACVAFAAIASVFHPRRFSEVSPALAHRAHCLYQQLRQALRRHIASVRQVDHCAP